MSKAVDDFISRRVQPEHRDVVALVRKLMREGAPAATEEISYGMPMWKANRRFAWLSPTKTDITFGFSRGADFADRYALLRGVGKRSKHVKLRSVGDPNVSALRYYIRQAVKHDAKP
jgi:hypothetical protein